MHLHEDLLLLMVKERTEKALRDAERHRVARANRSPRRPVRAGVGAALIRLGTWLLGDRLPPQSTDQLGASPR
jgi:hypothetical protein